MVSYALLLYSVGPTYSFWNRGGILEKLLRGQRKLELLKVGGYVRGIFSWLFFFFFLLIVDSVGVQLLTATYKHCCRIPLSLLQILGLLCCNFRGSVFVHPIIDLILVLKFQQVAIVGTDLADFYIWNRKSKHQRQCLVVN